MNVELGKWIAGLFTEEAMARALSALTPGAVKELGKDAASRESDPWLVIWLNLEGDRRGFINLRSSEWKAISGESRDTLYLPSGYGYSLVGPTVNESRGGQLSIQFKRGGEESLDVGGFIMTLDEAIETLDAVGIEVDAEKLADLRSLPPQGPKSIRPQIPAAVLEQINRPDLEGK